MNARFPSLKQITMFEKYFNILRFQNIFKNSRHTYLEELAQLCVAAHRLRNTGLDDDSCSLVTGAVRNVQGSDIDLENIRINSEQEIL
jgi:hypothetical protein